jgi:hypothetical protein
MERNALGEWSDAIVLTRSHAKPIALWGLVYMSPLLRLCVWFFVLLGAILR